MQHDGKSLVAPIAIRATQFFQVVAAMLTASIRRKIPYVTAHSVTGVLAKNPSASLREIRSSLGGGSLRDISRMVAAVRGRTIRDLRQTLAQDGDLGAAVVDVLGQLVLRVEQLQAEIAALRVALPARDSFLPEATQREKRYREGDQ
ncbi:hypothetical protein DFR29_12021 [Tahibacter aquaticus]|uniref:Uncharacterized protein n=1 Tax=Tahibacter aquaticus TaxID=520092 RepID=A0A4R6YMK9_9GAMM|nr:hypothetical protein [Tahibacter aquaticus]TDR38520.1 hypothetical protein DFR29_12021 [Tahibacter aquaticus]